MTPSSTSNNLRASSFIDFRKSHVTCVTECEDSIKKVKLLQGQCWWGSINYETCFIIILKVQYIKYALLCVSKLYAV